MRAAILIAACLAGLAIAQASIIEDTVSPTGVTYQEDAGKHGDAPATCETVDEDREVPADGSTWVMLVEIDDQADALVSNYGASDLGERLQVSAEAVIEDLTGIELRQYHIDVFAPGCEFSVVDPDAPIYQYESGEAPPEDPIQEGLLEKEVEGDPDREYDCNSSEWKFHANKIKKEFEPGELYVEWSNGDYEYIEPTHVSNGNVAMWHSTSNLDLTISRFVAAFPMTHDGILKIAHGPCDVSDWEAELPERSSDDTVEFTVALEGPHVIVITMTQGIHDTALGLLGATLPVPKAMVAAHLGTGVTHVDSRSDSTIHQDLWTQAIALKIRVDPPLERPPTRTCHSDECALAFAAAAVTVLSQPVDGAAN